MEIYTMKRPWMPLTPACAPSALVPACAAAPVAVPVLAEKRASVSRVHQVQIQAELVQALRATDGINGTNSSTGTNGTTGFKGLDVSAKRYTDGGSGVPPRGRPV